MTERTRLLLIDDNRDILKVMSVRLSCAGFDIRTESVSACAVATALQVAPQAIVLDLRMPAPDGFELLNAFRKDPVLRDIPVVVVSANVVEKSRRRALDLGARYFIEKPYQAATLVKAIHAALAERGEPVGVATGDQSLPNGDHHA